VSAVDSSRVGAVPNEAPVIDTVALAARIRRHALHMTSSGGSSHIGSILSMTDIVDVLYGAVLRVDPSDPVLSSTPGIPLCDTCPLRLEPSR